MKTKLDYLLAIVWLTALAAIAYAFISYKVWFDTAAVYQLPEPQSYFVPILEENNYLLTVNQPTNCAAAYEQLAKEDQNAFICFFDTDQKMMMGAESTTFEIYQKEQIDLTFSKEKDNLGHSWALFFKAPHGEVWHVQSYNEATSYSPMITDGPQMRFVDLNSGTDCSGGNFVIHEIGFDSDGRLNKLALDFESQCVYSNVQHVQGYIRYHATIPIIQ